MKKLIYLFLLLFFCVSVFSKSPKEPIVQELPYSPELKFIENKGQWESFITHKVAISNGTAFFQKNRITYHLFDTKQHQHLAHKRHEGTLSDQDSISLHAFHVQFSNANKHPRINGGTPHKEYYNYFLGNDPTKWASHVSAYSGVTYKNIYENIDFKIYEYATTLKYEFVVHPKGNPKNIVLEYDGLDSIFIERKRLVLKTSVGNIYENKPYVYQFINNKKIRIDCEFSLNEQNQLSFSLKEKYNKRFPLIIDPELIFSTYSGSQTDNWGNTACYDQQGNLYTGGTVFNDVANGFPTTIGAFQTTFNKNSDKDLEYLTDIGILKFNSEGTELLYGTYVGGDLTDIPISMIVNHANELVILGITNSGDFPTLSNSFDNTFNGSSDIVIFKLSELGDGLTGSTYLGGSNSDGITFTYSTLHNNYGDQYRGDITVDKNDNIYIASSSFSNNFPINNGFETQYQTNQDGIVLKMNSNLSLMYWSTYLGGTEQDIALSIQLDTNNDVWVAGGTTSSNFPTTKNVWKQNFGGISDGYIAQIQNDGTQLLQSTFVGTDKFDQTYFIQLDQEENLYVLGQTKGVYPITKNVYANVNSGIFIHKFNTKLQSLLSTTIGSSTNNISFIKPNISPTAFLVNECNNILLSGWGGETNEEYNRGNTYNMPITKNAYQTTTDGSDFYLMVLSENADSLLYGSYFGGPNAAEHVDGGTSRFDERGIVYQSVCAGCDGYGSSNLNYDFPLHPPQTDSTSYPQYNNSTDGGQCNNAVFKLDLTNLKAEIGKVEECVSNFVNFSNLSFGSQDFVWDLGDGTTNETNSLATFGHTYEKAGEYTVTLIATDFTTCKKRDTAQVTIKVIESFGKNYADTLCIDEIKEIKVDSFSLDKTYQWTPTTFILSQENHKATIQPKNTITYTVDITDDLGCIRTDSIFIRVPNIKTNETPQIIGNCEYKIPKVFFRDKVLLSEPFDIEYFWDLGDGTTYSSSTFSHQYTEYDTFTVSMSTKVLHCTWDTTFQVILEELYVPNIITPNTDEVNDQLIISGIKNSGAWKLDVYNRWGEAIYRHEDYDNTWTGENLYDGTYFYLLTAPDLTTCKGWIQITR